MAGPRSGEEDPIDLIEGAREDLLGYEPSDLEDGYEEMRARVDRKLRQAQMALAKGRDAA